MPAVTSPASPVSPWSKYPLPEAAEVAPVPKYTRIVNSIIYPESEENPIPEGDLQHLWLALIEENIAFLLIDNPLVYVAGNLFWYPEEGNTLFGLSSDVMVAFGRPKGYRSSYKQWLEGGIPPQVVFEILSKSNTKREMEGKRLLYERQGVLEYYEYDTDNRRRRGWCRTDVFAPLERIPNLNGWVSPLLGIRFGETEDGDLCLFHPNGERFKNSIEVRAEQTEERDKRRAAEAGREETERLNALFAERLRALGVDVDALKAGIS